MSGNLGATRLRRRAGGNPMRDYDALPAELRGWLSRAALPWSPRSCLRLWSRARRRGLGGAAALATLDAAERRALARDGDPAGPGPGPGPLNRLPAGKVPF